MPGLKQIKNKIRSVDKTGKVTKAMEAVSAVKMRKTQERALLGRTYARAAVEILARMSNSRTLQNHPLMQQRDPVRALYIVITSDKGLAGALNSGVLRAAYADMESGKGGKENIGIIAIGRKANDFFSRRGFMVEAFHSNDGDSVSPELIREVVNEAAEKFRKKECDIVKIAYQNFISTFEQRSTLRTVFPLSLNELAEVVNGIVPKHGMFSRTMNPLIENSSPYTIEPSEEEVVNAILPRLASIFVYHALLESHASEHSARMVAMKSASDKARDLSKELTLDFNKARQAAITREVSEIIGGIEAMAV